MKKQMLLSFAAVALFASCVDNGYDLKNIDTNVKIEVKDLTVPMKLEAIKLEKILDLEDNARITKVNGEFAVVEKGSFTSNSTMGVDPIAMNTPTLTLASKQLDLEFPALANISGDITEEQKEQYTIQQLIDKGFLNDDEILLSFSIPSSHKAKMSINADNIDESVTSIKELKFDPVTANINIELPNITQLLSNPLSIENLIITLPRGLESNDKNFKEGKLTYPVFEIKQGKGKLTFQMEGVDYAESEKDGASFKNHTFSYDKECSVEGKVEIRVKDFNPNTTISKLTNTVQTYNCDIKFDKQIVIKEFSGGINYKIDEIKMNDINLSDIPDMLNQSGTKLILDDPQIYLSVNNPIVNKYPESNVNPNVDITLEPHPAVAETFTASFSVPEKDNKICLAPKAHTKYYETNEACSYIPFESLSRIIAGGADGQIPSSISIAANAKVVQEVENLKLDSNYGSVKGNYIFFAPLQLTSESRIKYSTTEDGWNDDDLDKLTIDKLDISFNISTDIPFGVSLSLVPLDKNGKAISGVSITNVSVDANAKKQAVNCTLTGMVQHLDGIRIDATAEKFANQALKPDMTIQVENLRVKVNGSYEKEL